ncbi:hypothetical protein OROGR_030435 [Orobanche gracilis]
MENQGPHSSGKVPGQAQMIREWDDMLKPPSDVHSQSQGRGETINFLQETGTQIKNMAQGAADVGKGATQGAVTLARGAAVGAANIAQGAADAIKNTIGINNPNDAISSDSSFSNTIGISNPRGAGTLTPNNMDSNINVDGLTYPTNDMSDSNNPCNRNTKI